MQNATHKGYQLADNSFSFLTHLKLSNEFQEAYYQAAKYYSQVFPYSINWQLIEAEEIGVVLLA